MRGVYTSEAKISALATAITLLYLQAPSTACVEIISASVTNGTNATNQELEIQLNRITSIGSAAGTANTPIKMENGDQAAGSTVAVNCTVEPTTYATGSYGDVGCPSLSGWFYQPAPEERLIIPPSGYVGIKILVAPTAFDAFVSIRFREIG